jgi:hypothetical protein
MVYPALSGPDNLEEWTEFRKAGPNGVFMVFMGLSWISDLADSPEHLVALEWLSEDISFILKKVANLVVYPKTAVNATAKRKAVDNSGGANKKKRNK